MDEVKNQFTVGTKLEVYWLSLEEWHKGKIVEIVDCGDNDKLYKIEPTVESSFSFRPMFVSEDRLRVSNITQ